jgi:hypothetical protein
MSMPPTTIGRASLTMRIPVGAWPIGWWKIGGWSGCP